MGCNDSKPLPRPSASDIERFWNFVDKRGPDECWPWTGGAGHYGVFWIDGRQVIAHRFAYFVQKGEDPYPNLVRHSCDYGLCCNGSHLLTGTQQENVQDAIDRDRLYRPSLYHPVKIRRAPETGPVPITPRRQPSQPEQWLPVGDYELCYEVSSHGRVRRILIGRKHVLRKLKTYTEKNGYVRVTLCLDGLTRRFLVHQLVASAFIGPCPDGMEISHKDGHRDNCIADNLEYLSHQANCMYSARVLKSYATGSRNGSRIHPRPRGSQHHGAVLTEDQVREIRRRYAAGGISGRQLAAEYGLTDVYPILVRRTWGHVT